MRLLFEVACTLMRLLFEVDCCDVPLEFAFN
jgi:hypothetical protein